MARRRRFFAVVFLVLFIALGGLNSCGGGTVGTDVGGATRILGRVVSTAGNALGNASITLEETGDSAISDENGNFTIFAELQVVELSLLIEAQGVHSRSRLQNIPIAPEEIRLTVAVDLESQESVITDTEITVRPTPQPTQKPEGTRKPRETPTPLAPPPVIASPTVSRSCLVTVRIKDLGVLFQTARYGLNGFASLPFSGNEQLAVGQFEISPSQAAGRMAIQTNFGIGSLDLSAIPAGAETLTIDASMYVGPDSQGSWRYGIATDAVSLSPPTLPSPVVTFNPGVNGSARESGLASFNDGVELRFSLRFDPSPFPAEVGFNVLNVPNSLSVVDVVSGEWVVILDPTRLIPDTLFLSINSSLGVSGFQIPGVPPSRAIVRAQVVVRYNSPQADSPPVQSVEVGATSVQGHE